MIEIARAAEADLEPITRLAASLASSALDEEARARHGFLVSGFDAGRYQRWLAVTQLFLVARVDEEIAGFMLAYPYLERERDDTFIAEARRRFLAHWSDERIVVIKQIAVRPQSARSGVARALYRHLFDIVDRPVCLCGAIVETPRNLASERFHSAVGLRHAGSLAHPDGCQRGFWLREL